MDHSLKKDNFKSQVKKRAEIRLSIFLQNFRTVFGDKKVKNVYKYCGNCAEKWTAECHQNYCSFFYLGIYTLKRNGKYVNKFRIIK